MYCNALLNIGEVSQTWQQWDLLHVACLCITAACNSLYTRQLCWNISCLLPALLVCSTPYPHPVCVRCDQWWKQAQDQLRLSIFTSSVHNSYFCRHTSAVTTLLLPGFCGFTHFLNIFPTYTYYISWRNAWAGLSACADWILCLKCFQIGSSVLKKFGTD